MVKTTLKFREERAVAEIEFQQILKVQKNERRYRLSTRFISKTYDL